FFFSSRRRHTRFSRDWSSDVCSSDLARSDALDPELAATAREARFIYLGSGSPMHLRSVLKDSPVWDAIVEAWQGGAVLAGTGAEIGRASCRDRVCVRCGGGQLTSATC